MLRRKFAVIKLWPHAKAAEDEVIARLKLAAGSLDLECLVVDSFARLIHPPHTQLTQDDVDFVLSLHFETPKRFDIFSFVTLWNPLQFYYEWGYRKCTRHLLTHDDFLSSASVSGDDHVLRFIADDPKRDGPHFRFYPTVSGPMLEPTVGDRKLLYVGINWERLAKKAGRHEGLLSLLDKTGDLRIYGPKVFGGMEVWHGYTSYVSSVPFDGVSIVRLIHQAGISLVLSSSAHLQSEMMSCRIFESAAAGAAIICDQNPFARRFFGDSLLYIDTSLPPEETYGQVQYHLDWIKSEPEKARQMAQRAQEIFRENFRLDALLERIYLELPDRKQHLERLYAPKVREEKICVVFLMPEYRREVLEQHIASCRAQKNVAIRGIVAMDDRDAEIFGPRVRSRLGESPAPLEIAAVHFTERRSDGSVKRRSTAGAVFHEVLANLVREDYVCVVAPYERLFSDHLSALLRTLQDSEGAGCAWSDMLVAHRSNGEEQADLSDDPDTGSSADAPPIGCGRFLFRLSAMEPRLRTALPYLDTFAMHLLFGTSKSVPTRRCTLVSAGTDRAEEPAAVTPAALEREILIDFSPEAFRIRAPKRIEEQRQPQPTAPWLAEMTPEQKTGLAVELAHAVPLPSLVKQLVFGVYRLWFRFHSSLSRSRTRPS
jgi:hypothetical protein